MNLKVYLISYIGVWLEAEAIVVASSEIDALLLFMEKFSSVVEVFDVSEIDVSKPSVRVINDGDY